MGSSRAAGCRAQRTRFPKLRIGAIEVSAQWVPYVLKDMTLRNMKRGVDTSDDVLTANRIYIACQTDDDLPYILEYAGEDVIMIGADYGHADNASELLALKGLRDKGHAYHRQDLAREPRAILRAHRSGIANPVVSATIALPPGNVAQQRLKMVFPQPDKPI